MNDRRKFLKKAGLSSLGMASYGLFGSNNTMAESINNNNQQQAEEIGDLKLLDWEPVSQLIVKETNVLTPKFPPIDIHNHFRDHERLDEYLKAMDEAGVWKVVSLDGYSADDFYIGHLKACKKLSQERIIVFFRPDFRKIDEQNFGEREAEKLERAVEMGIRGLKIGKSLGLEFKDQSGQIIPVDDPRIDPIWAKCGELGIPVLIHVSDPKAFFTPVDRYNERYDELGANPHWSFYGDEYPDKEEILNQRNRVIERHPDTTFIGAHMGNLPEELERVSMWLDKYPNFYVDIDARISELGRQPYTARKFINHYQDRVLFGTDTRPNVEAYKVYWRFLETDDEYIFADPSHHRQGRWRIYGIHLSDNVLEKMYNKNALKIFDQFKG